MNIEKILETSKSMSDIARHIFGKENYTNREKSKKILEENGINWEEWLKSKKPQPKKCLNCGVILTGKDKNRKIFCSHSCAASYNNKLKGFNTKQNKTCLYCGKIIKYNKFCNTECKVNYNKSQFIKKWLNGEVLGCNRDGSLKKYIRDYLLEHTQYKCQNCGFNTPNPFTGNSILQVHHINGDCYDTTLSNLLVLCPNCHALTENFGSRNSNSTRVDRRTKYFKKVFNKNK